MTDIIMQSHPQPIFIYDSENLQFLEVNAAAIKLYGYSRDEFNQMDLTDLYSPEDIQSLIQTTGGKGKDGVFTGPWRHKKKDGTAIIVELAKSSLHYKGRNAHINVICDSTKKYQNETKLKHYKSVNDLTSEMVMFTDPEGIITNINDTVIKKIGQGRQEITGNSILSFLNDKDRGSIISGILKNDNNDLKSVETEIKRKSGNNLPVEIRAAKIFDSFGRVDSFAIILKIIEEDRNGEISAGQTKSDSPGVVDAEFLSNMFHEILTPINVIIGFNQELYESIDKPNDEQKEAIEIISENQKMLLGIMDTVAEYAYLKQNQDNFKIGTYQFIEILNNLEKEIKTSAEKNKVELNYGKISSSLSIETDLQKFNLFLNLFFDFGMRLTKEDKIYISAVYLDQENCFVGIRDKRIGISESLLSALNDIFVKDENTLRKNYGISRLTHKLINLLKKILDIKIHTLEKSGEIIEFGISLPIKFRKEILQSADENESGVSEVKKAAEYIIPENISSFVTEKEVKSEKSVSEISCLYLEDQIDSQILFKTQVKEISSIDFSVSLEEAIPLIKSKKYDLVIMDMNLQGEYNGLDALRIIRKMPGYTNTPVIACSAYVLPGDRDKYKQSGFTDFISKPLMREKILKAIEGVFTTTIQ